MRKLQKNKVEMYYSLYGEEVPIYDYYTDNEGNKIPIDTGETKVSYSQPVKFFGNINESQGESEAMAFGVSIADYNAVLVADMLPIDETSIIWKETEPKINEDGTVDEHSADYRITKVASTLNEKKYLLKAIVK